MARRMHRAMQEVCKSPEGQNTWPSAAELLNDAGNSLLVKGLWQPSFALTKMQGKLPLSACQHNPTFNKGKTDGVAGMIFFLLDASTALHRTCGSSKRVAWGLSCCAQ